MRARRRRAMCGTFIELQRIEATHVARNQAPTFRIGEILYRFFTQVKLAQCTQIPLEATIL